MIAKDPTARPRDGHAVADCSRRSSSPIFRRGASGPARDRRVRARDRPDLTTKPGSGRLASIVVATPPDAAESELPAGSAWTATAASSSPRSSCSTCSFGGAARRLGARGGDASARPSCGAAQLRRPRARLRAP